MNLTDIALTLSQKTDSTHPGVFPFPFSYHITLVAVGVIFFAIRFSAQKRPYQLIIAVAMLISLALWLSDNRAFYYLIGITEALLLIAAFITSIVCKPKEKTAEAVSDAGKSDESTSEQSSQEEE